MWMFLGRRLVSGLTKPPASRRLLLVVNESSARRFASGVGALECHRLGLEGGEGALVAACYRILCVRILGSLCGAVFLAVICLSPCRADMIVLESQSGGVFDYELSVPSGIDFSSNTAAIVLSGLSGVTGATVSGDLAANCGVAISIFLVPSFTSTSVTLTTGDGVCLTSAGTLGTLSVTSSVTTTGTVNYALNTETNGTESGTVQGPVASAAPEPATLPTLVTALATFVFVRRRKTQPLH
jgi:hypothetical protein